MPPILGQAGSNHTEPSGKAEVFLPYLLPFELIFVLQISSSQLNFGLQSEAFARFYFPLTATEEHSAISAGCLPLRFFVGPRM